MNAYTYKKTGLDMADFWTESVYIKVKINVLQKQKISFVGVKKINTYQTHDLILTL